MARPNLDIAANMAVVQPYLARLNGCVRRAFDRYQNEYPGVVRAEHDDAAAAKCVHRHALAELVAEFDGARGVCMVDARGLNVLNIQDRAVLRFKKMNEEGRSVSYPTEQALSFDKQLPLEGLPPAATRLTFGYEPDLAFSAIVRVLLACPLGPRIHWCAQVNEEPGDTVSWVDITPRRLPGTERFRPYGTGDV